MFSLFIILFFLVALYLLTSFSHLLDKVGADSSTHPFDEMGPNSCAVWLADVDPVAVRINERRL
ncbi:MAG: hypothetical protein R3E79_27770 [Caldilineaceae bacterium]